jgi:ABC-type antimicrobial peptide transport system permease subunit
MVVSDGLRVALLGVAIGAMGALAVGRLIQTLLFGVTPSDPLTYGVLAVALLAVAFLASFLPARRAAQVDPTTALRAE